MRTPHHMFRPCARDGFTLIELVAVIGIILMMTLVVVGSYVGITRAIAARAGINHVRNAVLVTRQHACMDGQRTYLYVLNESEYVICRRAGRVSENAFSTTFRNPATERDENGFAFRDHYTDLDSYINELDKAKSGLTVYNFDSSHAQPYATAALLQPISTGGWTVILTKTSKFSMNPLDFKAGNTYGIEIYTKRALPRGYTFVNGTPFKPFANFFEPTGEAGGTSGTFTPIEIIETIKPTLVQSVRVSSGKIVVDTKGTED